MTPLEAMMRLITLADYFRIEEGGRPNPDEQSQDDTAVAVAQRMLHTALPIARYRAFVEVNQIPDKRKRQVLEEFTVCATTARSILGGLIGLNEVPLDVRVTLWEQRKDGAEMLSGYQGRTKTKNYRTWLAQVAELDTAGATVQ